MILSRGRLLPYTMGMKRNCCFTGAATGFLLLEALPALLLLAAILVTGAGLKASRMRSEARMQQQEYLETAFQETWQSWKNSTSRAAVAQVGDDGGWKVVQFPDAGWLPPAGTGAGAGFRASYALRRSSRLDEDGCGYWEIEVQKGATGDWQWWARVYESKEEP